MWFGVMEHVLGNMYKYINEYKGKHIRDKIEELFKARLEKINTFSNQSHMHHPKLERK